MPLDDVTITRAIASRYFEKLMDCLEVDVALVGGGPSNLVCGALLGEAGVKTVLLESKLAPGGGMWGGGMMFNEIVLQDSALGLAERLGIRTSPYEDDYHTADSVDTVATLISRCHRAGTRILNLVKVVDVMFRPDGDDKRVSGLVIQWTPVDHMGLHVDPLTMRASCVVDGTGHPAEVCSILCDKLDAKLDTPTGKVVGEMPMWADRGEALTVENATEVYPGLYVTGMAANAARGAPRMGPVFGGMLLSGEKVARTIIEQLGDG